MWGAAAGHCRGMPTIPTPRGPLSAAVATALRTGRPVAPLALSQEEPVRDHDLQLALWMLYELFYAGFHGVDPDAEWRPDLLELRAELEVRFEEALRRATRDLVTASRDAVDDLPGQVDHLIASVDVPGVAAYLHREATHEEFLDYLRGRSVYHLKESDPHTFVLPRVSGATKAALAELQYDEYGAGRPDGVHSSLYADALASVGLDPAPGAYVDEVDATVLAQNNVMSLFGLHRRLRGAALGHLAAFEATSAMPCRRIAAGAERLGLPAPVIGYYEEHVEADAVHEHLAVRGVCGALVAGEPALHEDVLFGVAACLHLDAVWAATQLEIWTTAQETEEVAS